MTGAVLDRPRSFCEPEGSHPEHGPSTLEALLDSVLDGTRRSGSAECPVCSARMSLTRAHAKCGGCGSRLS